MNTTHEVRLGTDEHFGHLLPPRHLGFFLAELPVAVKQAISMALRNRSSVQGRTPLWLDRAADIRFAGHSGNGEVVLHFEIPTMGEAAAEIYRQQELWPTRPDAQDTGFDLLGDVLADVAARNADSEHFDPQLLTRIARFKKVLAGPYREISICSRRYAVDSPARISPETIATAQGFYARTPASRRTRLVGRLDMLRVSTQTFALRLDDGQEVRGVLPEGSIEEIKPLLDRRVLVLGKAVYRASERLLRVDADTISPGENEPSIWSQIPAPGMGRLDTSKLRRPQGPRSGMAAIMGQWPGEETDEEIEAALEKLS
ncbi:MAG: hypothetical protein ACYC35_08300 [Pirellulales bacterium]